MMTTKPHLALLALAALFCTGTNAFYGIGGCPTQYPKVTTPFGSSGVVPNNVYYSHYIDTRWHGFLE